MGGIFVERTNRIMQLDLEHTKMEETMKRANWIAVIRHVFADECGVAPHASCPVTAEMFRASTNDKRMKIFLERLGLNIDEDNALPVFSIIDEGEFGSVPLNELLFDLEMLSGAARQLDVNQVLRHVRRLREDMRVYLGDPQKREGQPQWPQLTTDMGNEDLQRMVARKSAAARPRLPNSTGSSITGVSCLESDLPGAIRGFARGPSSFDRLA
eukprot:NODE_3402_length_791_cov_258.849185.p1 GENE.NODE_3402_length_791_cov_258.849185~~NODE_3402_length_791_cov_258.849185.p1  ORF type:complete len:213 (+),score=65.59 NODE_3402_length_791_cov_258.849185:3-641(+)